MANQLPDGERNEKLARTTLHQPNELREFLDLLARLNPGEGARKLQFDLARDAAVDVFRRLRRRMQRLEERMERREQQRDTVQRRHLSLLHDLAVGGVVFTRPVGSAPVTSDELIATFRRLRSVDFPHLARLLRDTGDFDPAIFMHLLVEEVLINGAALLVGHLARHSREERTIEEEKHFLDELRHRVAGFVNQSLARRTGYRMRPEMGGHLDTLLADALPFLEDLLTSTPAMRLLIPSPGDPCDPDQHERHSGRPLRSKREVKAVWFPGLITYGPEGGTLEKAQVVTRRVSRSAQRPPDEGD